MANPSACRPSPRRPPRRSAPPAAKRTPSCRRSTERVARERPDRCRCRAVTLTWGSTLLNVPPAARPTGNARSPLGFEGLPATLQRVHLADDGPQFAGVDPPGQLRQGRPVGLDDEEGAACFRTPRLRKGGDDRDEPAPRPDDGPGPPRKFTAYEVEDHVDLARHVLEASAFRVDELVGPELTHEPFGPLPSRGHDVGARAAGQLDGEDADAASRTVDQHALACRETAMVEQRLPG